VRDRQEGSEVDLDFELEQNSTNKTVANKTRANNRLALNNRPLPQTPMMTNLYEPQTITYPIEKKEFDYDFVSLTTFLNLFKSI